MARDNGHLVALVYKWGSIFFSRSNVQEHAGRFVAEISLGNCKFIGTGKHILKNVFATYNPKP